MADVGRARGGHHVKLLFVERADRALHVWLGPLGLHLFWPDVWRSRLGYCARWREPAIR